MALYTPFFERSMAVVGQGLKQREINELAQAAYLGDPQAMATLQGVAPDIAQGMERTAIMGGEANARAQAAQEQARIAQERETRLRQEQEASNAAEVQEFAQQALQDSTRFDTYEEASAYISNQAQMAGVELPPIPEELWSQAKTVFADENTKQRTEKITALTARLQDRVENPQELATGIVDGSIQVEVNEATGQVQLIDEAAAVAGDARAVIELPIAAFAEEDSRPVPEEGQTLWDLAPLVAGS